jgi:hypothetical protein
MKFGSANAVKREMYVLIGERRRLRIWLWVACECRSALFWYSATFWFAKVRTWSM